MGRRVAHADPLGRMTSRGRRERSAMGAPPAPSIRVRDLAAWRRWLRAHHDDERVIWLVFAKKAPTVPCVSYDDALDEALCWGWIDSIVRGMDETTYARKFTRRTDPDRWSAANIARLRRLLASGRMQPSGRAAVSAAALRRAASALPAERRSKDAPPIPAELFRALDESPVAKAFFAALAPSYRRNYVRWVSSAKQPATRERRATEAAQRLAQGEKTLLE